jgi:Response regulator containing a CheY-like receiver domain and an HTH DNA-binding domain
MPHSKIVIADDHPLFRTALKQAVNKAAKHVEIVEVSSMSELQDAASEHNDADLVLLDLTMPGASGFSGLVYLKGQIPELPVMVVSGMKITMSSDGRSTMAHWALFRKVSRLS